LQGNRIKRGKKKIGASLVTVERLRGVVHEKRKIRRQVGEKRKIRDERAKGEAKDVTGSGLI